MNVVETADSELLLAGLIFPTGDDEQVGAALHHAIMLWNQ
jgi:hypothetical protein